MKAPAPAKILVLFGILCITPVFACAQVDGILCTDGEGIFTSKFETGVTVAAGASETHGLASRSCEATLSYGKTTVKVVEDAWQVDVDVMGASLARGKPIVGIQYKKHSIDRQMTYAIYSLNRPPQLLRTIKGGDFFRAADFDFDGQIEIRTGDVAAADGFEGIPLSGFDSAPAVFLRFEDGKLIDASSEFRKEYDQEIAELKASLDPAALAAFKSTNGKLDSIFLLPADQMHSLVTTKIKVLEIVWSYLYSGREAEAWGALGDMWPASDIDRIRAAIVEAQTHGILTQVDGISTSGPHLKIKRLHVYDTTVEFQLDSPGNSELPQIGPSGQIVTQGSGSPKRSRETDTDPMPIYIRTGCSTGDCSFLRGADIRMELLLDDAGKVHSAKPVDSTLKDPAFDILLKSALSWKFVPAYEGGHPVACKTWQIISPYR